MFQSTLKTELEQLVEQESKRLSEIEKTQQLAQEEMLLAQRQAESVGIRIRSRIKSL